MPFEKQYNGHVVKKCIQMYERFHSFRKVERMTGVGKSTIHRWYLKFGKLAYNLRVSRKRKIRKTRKQKYPDLEEKVSQLFECQNIKYLSKKDILSQLDIKPSISTIHNVLKRCKISRRRFDKTGKVCCDKTSEAFLERENEFKESFLASNYDEIVCIDETGFCNIGNPVYGYFQRGKQPTIPSNKSRVKRNIVMAITSNDVIDFTISQKPYNSTTFLQFIESLIPKLPQTTKYLLMDNVAFHRSKVLKEVVDKSGLELLFIPPYSPQYNPIEEVFADVKRHFRRSLIIEQHVIDQAIRDAITHLKDNRTTITSHYLSTEKKCSQSGNSI